MQNKMLESDGQADAIEITPKMIEAGKSVLFMYFSEFSDAPEQIVTELWLEMTRVL
jgi:hypothetical protein